MKIHKKASLLILTALLLSCAITENGTLTFVDKHDHRLKQQGEYLLLDETPFDGMLIESYENSDPKSHASYKNGMLEGISRTWYPGIKKESERYYELGEKEGIHRSWWQNGNLRFEYQFQAGLYHGTFKEWYENGKPLHIFEYARGNEVKAVGWRENGKTYINFAVRNGKKYGLTNARLCYSLKDEQGIFQTSNN